MLDLIQHLQRRRYATKQHNGGAWKTLKQVQGD